MLTRSGFTVPARTTSHGDWIDLLRTHFVALDVPEVGTERFTGSVRSQSIAHLQVSSVDSTSQRIERNGTLIDADSGDFIQVGMIRRGTAVVRQDGRECALGRDDFVVYDTTRPFEWMCTGDPHDDQWSLEVFTWPRATLALTERDSSDLTAIRLDGRNGMSGVLGRFLHDLVVSRSGAGTAGAHAVADEIGDLVSVIARTATGVPPVGIGSSSLRDINGYIDDHLGDPTLSPVVIADAMGVSTRHLHRLFADHQMTVSRSIRTRRLEKCRREIIACVAVDRSLSQISRRWGFTDLAVFSRAFKSEFGMSPRQYRAMVAEQSGDAHAVTRPRRPGDPE
ncbi:helix-turn-helix domain-containing protein [Williamsia maris]|uniref:AraC-type DNA-binding protein n=1 Tax=Williamsia maris TaxID=72806 RepID=A0ABT1HJF0_9NOCA|nr:helix-turn-helix domain-containing protein [Williamsia maris]MCP2178065.1 AraC-type DNA-binding protein [Williamsia maris]